MMTHRGFLSLSLIILACLLIACDQSYTPKPRGYFRIELPEKQYTLYDSLQNYRFEYPAYAQAMRENRKGAEEDWVNIDFPGFKGSLYISYKPVDQNLSEYVEDTRSMLLQHIPKASGITDSLIIDSERRVYGLLYRIKGKGAASPLQFYLTDSTRHFIRGALYFNIRPNNDSLAPVIDFLKTDIDHLVQTLEWK